MQLDFGRTGSQHCPENTRSGGAIVQLVFSYYTRHYTRRAIFRHRWL